MKFFLTIVFFALPALIFAEQIGVPEEPPQVKRLEIEALRGIEAEMEFFYIDGTPPGFLAPQPGDQLLISPRVTLPVDLFWDDWLYGFGKMRFDRGFHPSLHETYELRADEYFFRFGSPERPFQFQVGKFATMFGGWVRRHETDDDAFLNGPLAYDELTSVVDPKLFSGIDQIAANRQLPNNIHTWLPIVWGPVYTPGFAVFGGLGDLDYAVEMKSRAVSSRPSVWDDWDFVNPTWTGRLGYRPNAAWNFGASASHGSYLRSSAGPRVGDFDQTTFGIDLSYAHHHWQVWAEVLYSQFELPNIRDNAEVWSYFIETRYKLSPRVFTALRWNQQFYNELNQPGFGDVRWDNDLFRIEAALGFRLTPNLEAKLQYGWTHQEADFQNGENLVGLQVSGKLR